MAVLKLGSKNDLSPLVLDNPMLYYSLGFLVGPDGKESACNAGDTGWEDPLKEEMAPHSSILAWTIPCTEESSGL